MATGSLGAGSTACASVACAHGELRGFWQEIAEGLPLDPATAVRLMRCTQDELPLLLAAACRTKERFRPGVITYSRKLFLPITNLCRNRCGYCAFRRDPAAPEAHTMTLDEIRTVLSAGEKLGCREALVSAGDKPEAAFPEMRRTLRHMGYHSTLQYVEAVCEFVLRESSLLPHANAGVIGPQWLERLSAVCPSLGLMIESTSTALLAAGAAHHRAPDKIPARRLHMVEEAGRRHIPFTTGLLIGIGESIEDRVETLFAIRELHRRYGHIQEVIVQNFRAKPLIPMSHSPEPSQDEMLRTVAVARLVLRDINLQAPPNLSSQHYDVLLSAGINDWGGISPLTPDFINPEAAWPPVAELQRRTEAAGQKLKERLCIYPEYVPALTAKPGLLAGRVRAAQEALILGS